MIYKPMSSKGERQIIELLERIATAMEQQNQPKTSSKKKVIEVKEE